MNEAEKALLVKKAPYKLDLSSLHALCEANYARMMQLFPDYETRNSKQFLLPGGARVCLDIVERCRYTTVIKAQQIHSGEPWLESLQLEVRTYHDARMAEVSRFQTQQQRAQGRYHYPNTHMYQQDEKLQQNQFLADWLSYCLQRGCADDESLVRTLQG